jgi:hypothetical protein
MANLSNVSPLGAGLSGLLQGVNNAVTVQHLRNESEMFPLRKRAAEQDTELKDLQLKQTRDLMEPVDYRAQLATKYQDQPATRQYLEGLLSPYADQDGKIKKGDMLKIGEYINTPTGAKQHAIARITDIDGLAARLRQPALGETPQQKAEREAKFAALSQERTLLAQAHDLIAKSEGKFQPVWDGKGWRWKNPETGAENEAMAGMIPEGVWKDQNPQTFKTGETRSIQKGGENVTEEWTGQGWKEIGRGPKFKPGGGGGGGADEGGSGPDSLKVGKMNAVQKLVAQKYLPIASKYAVDEETGEPVKVTLANYYGFLPKQYQESHDRVMIDAETNARGGKEPATAVNAALESFHASWKKGKGQPAQKPNPVAPKTAQAATQPPASGNKSKIPAGAVKVGKTKDGRQAYKLPNGKYWAE